MDKESRKKQILQCTCRLFAEQGYDATSLAQIAKGCGCSPSLVIRHFGSKENLYNALLEQFEAICKQPLIASVPEGTAMERLEKLYHMLVYEIPPVEDAHSLLFSALQSRGKSQELRAKVMRHIQDVGMEILLPVLRDGVAEGAFPPELDCEKTARLLWLCVKGTRMAQPNYPSIQILPFSSIKELLLGI